MRKAEWEGVFLEEGREHGQQSWSIERKDSYSWFELVSKGFGE